MLNWKLLPKNSVFLCGLAAVTSVAVLSWLNIRPVSLAFLLLFIYWFYKTRSNMCIKMSSEFQMQRQKTLGQLRNWKEAKPAAFCIITSLCLAILAIIGHFISGSVVVLIGLAFAALVSTKYNFQLVTKESADLSTWSDESGQEFEVEDELMPEINEKNFTVLESAAESWSSQSYDKIDKTNETDSGEDSDEVPTELLLPPDALPDIQDIENSSEDDELNDSLSLPAEDLFKYAIDQDNSSSSGSAISNVNDNEPQLIDGIQFKKGYFKQSSELSTPSTSTSTSLSEESLSKGLHFPDHTLIATASPSVPSQQQQQQQQLTSKAQAEALLSHGSKLLLPGFVSGIMHGLLGANINSKSSLASANKRQGSDSNAYNENYMTIEESISSDESDFELINNSDLN